MRPAPEWAGFLPEPMKSDGADLMWGAAFVAAVTALWRSPVLKPVRWSWERLVTDPRRERRQADITAAMTNSSNSDLALGDLNGDGVQDVFVGYTTGNNEVRFANTRKTTNIARLSLLTQADALATFATIDAEITRVSQQQGTLGAAMSRVQAAVSVLEQSREGFLSAESRNNPSYSYPQTFLPTHKVHLLLQRC